ncbi:hypothetical protein GE061_003448 [Apolygus lucorum]|uniref:Uncharacterized protein n=1 Tax=Apolygus lucorum TaxID=248454 RepID=A0A6A4JKD2_APOLU|nr:hypothetical protein GE061_003448 [Apolygus lucorum]
MYNINRLSQDRRRPRRDNAVPASPYLHSFLCCDVVNRMREDINCLCQDTKRLGKQRENLEGLQKKFEAICTEVRQKLKSLPWFKVHHSQGNQNLTEMNAIEARDFLKYTWSLANSCLDKRAKKKRFMSIRGICAADYIKQVTSFSDYIQHNYGNEFYHVECAALYTHLTRQLQGLLVPEMMKGDLIEFSTHYISLAMPAMITFISFINTYVTKPRITDLNDLCNEIFYRGAVVSNRPCRTPAVRLLASLLRGDLLAQDPIPSTKPVVEGRATNFYQAAAQLAQHLLKVSTPSLEPQSTVPVILLGPGLLDPRFQSGLPPIKKALPTPVPVIPQPVVPPEPTTSVIRTPSTRGRGRPRKRAM